MTPAIPMPGPLVVAVLLGVLAVALFVFRLGMPH
jgi:hypothetical protein